MKSFVAPLLDTYAVTEMPTEAHGLQVDLSPLGAYMLFGVAMHELSDVVVPLAGLLGSAAGLLAEQLFEAADWETRFDLLEAFISARVEQTRQPSPDVAWAWRRLSETSGRLPIGRLAEELGCSRRHLAARFREQIGPTPKTAAKILRFRRAAVLLTADGGERFAEIAQDCGYYDQAHLNRDFRDFAGTTPGAYVERSQPDGSGYSPTRSNSSKTFAVHGPRLERSHRGGIMSGQPSHIEIGVPDIGHARAFYGELLGWKFEETGNGARVETGGLPAGLHRYDGPSSVQVFYAVPDLDAAVSRVIELGGEVDEGGEEGESGRWLYSCRDDQGVPFGLHEPPTS